MSLSRRAGLSLIVFSLIALSLGAWWYLPKDNAVPFDGEQAMKFAEAQMAFGPRPPGSEANRQTGDYILQTLTTYGWLTESQEFVYRDTPIRNVTGKAAVGRGEVVIVGAHYDTRWFADQDPISPNAPVPGASDGASGVAVLLELARTLDQSALNCEVWLAFFDAEDNGGIDGWDWIVGSTFYADSLTISPKAMILADMVGDADQQLYFDASSHPGLSSTLFTIAADLGYGAHFIPVPKYAMLDDHTPFMQKGIPAVDLIDFDYPYWHTTEDTLDKIGAASLERVGRVIAAYLNGCGTIY